MPRASKRIAAKPVKVVTIVDLKKVKKEAKKDTKKVTKTAIKKEVKSVVKSTKTTVPLTKPDLDDVPDIKTVKFIGKIPVNLGENILQFQDFKVMTFSELGPAYSSRYSEIPIHAMLNQTNIGHNNNKYYLIQAIQNTKTGSFYAYFRWGRVGKTGGTKLQSAPTAEAALVYCKKQFRSKTGNDFMVTAIMQNEFVKKSGKYELIEMDYGEVDKTETKKVKKSVVKKEASGIPDSILKPEVQNLLKLIFDLKRIEKEMREMNFDTKRSPLGKVSQKQISTAYEILTKIENKLKTTNSSAAILSLSDEYYTKIPHDFGMRVPPRINTTELLNKEVRLLEALGDIEVVTKLVNNQSESIDPVNPLDEKYKELDCRISDATKIESTKIQQLLTHTHAPTHSQYESIKLIKAFKLTPSNQNEHTFKDFKNHDRKLLWHGTRITNVCGILKQGLRIAPPEAPVSGYMFGKGIYFADSCSKSANYCGVSRSDNQRVMFLADVAVGKMREIHHSDYEAADKLAGLFDSTRGIGRMVPEKEEKFAGAMVPRVSAKTSGCVLVDGKDPGASLQYNEFIVYDTQQVHLKYMCHVEFEFDASGGGFW